MVDDSLQYDVMVEEALRGVVRQALTRVAERGLPGDHHFYITFRTEAPGVTLPADLKERFPAEMTIVLQFQYWGLEVGERSFSVTLSFNDKLERLVIPFAAVSAFADPSVRFGLQFDSHEGEDDEGDADAADLAFGTIADGPAQEGDAPDMESLAAEAAELEETAAKRKAEDEQADKVVTLDAFRKK